MRAALLNGCGVSQQRFRFQSVDRIDCRDLRRARRQRAGFIKSDLLNAPQRLQRGTAFNQRAKARGGCKARRDSRRRRDHQRARATNQQQRQRFVNPRQPGRGKQQWRNKRRQQRRRHNDRGIDAAEAIDKALNRRAFRFRLFNQMQNAVNSAVAGARRDFERHQTIDAGRASRDFFAWLALNRQRFAGQRALIETRRRGEQFAVCRKPAACGHFNHIAGLEVAYRHGFARLAAQTHRRFRA